VTRFVSKQENSAMKLKMHQKKNENKMGYPNKPEKRGEDQTTSKGKKDLFSLRNMGI
jgi:hypothetical protein